MKNTTHSEFGKLLENSYRAVNIALIDECYERNVNLLLSSQVSILEIYRGSKLSKVFKRTYSRIIEMTSKEYLSRPHLH